jgi:hypothetical protein
MYLSCTPSADASGYNTVARSGYAAVGVSTIVDPWFTKMKPFYDPPAATFDGFQLDANVAGAWVYVWSVATAVVPTGAAGYEKAFGVCIMGKSTDNKNMPVYLYEADLGLPTKFTDYASLGANAQALVNAVFNVAGGAANVDPVAWRKSRGSFYSQRWVSWVVDTNEKLRRVRRIK